MEIKAPIPVVPMPGWEEIKDLQEWEKYHQERTGNDQTSEALTAIADAFRSGNLGVLDYYNRRWFAYVGATETGLAPASGARRPRERAQKPPGRARGPAAGDWRPEPPLPAWRAR